MLKKEFQVNQVMQQSLKKFIHTSSCPVAAALPAIGLSICTEEAWDCDEIECCGNSFATTAALPGVSSDIKNSIDCKLSKSKNSENNSLLSSALPPLEKGLGKFKESSWDAEDKSKVPVLSVFGTEFSKVIEVNPCCEANWGKLAIPSFYSQFTFNACEHCSMNVNK